MRGMPVKTTAMVVNTEIPPAKAQSRQVPVRCHFDRREKSVLAIAERLAFHAHETRAAQP